MSRLPTTSRFTFSKYFKVDRDGTPSIKLSRTDKHQITYHITMLHDLLSDILCITNRDHTFQVKFSGTSV